MRFAHVIFDCDGVLIDSESIAIKVEAKLFAELGLKLDEAEIASLFIGKSAEYQAQWVEARLGKNIRAAYEQAHAHRMLEAFEKGIPPVPGIKAALQSITAPKSVATNSVRQRTTYALTTTGLIDFFDSRLNCVDDVAHPKPAPDLYLLAAHKANVDPSSCVVVEDSPTGVRAAHAAGMTVIGFTGTAHDKTNIGDNLIKAGASILLEDMRGLHTALDWL